MKEVIQLNYSEYLDSLEPSIASDWQALEDAIQENMFFWLEEGLIIDRQTSEAGVTDWLEMLIETGAI